MSRSLGQLLGDAWEKIIVLSHMAKRGTRDMPSQIQPGDVGTWRGDRYVYLWNWRTGRCCWVKL